MPEFSTRSMRRLKTCHPDLQAVLLYVVARRDCTIIEGVRTLTTQREYLRTGRSQTLKSKHLKQSDGYSHAVDVAPYPVDWRDPKAFALFAGYVLAVADMLHEAGEITHRIRWGGDWDGDGNVREHSLFDGPHMELVP